MKSDKEPLPQEAIGTLKKVLEAGIAAIGTYQDLQGEVGVDSKKVVNQINKDGVNSEEVEKQKVAMQELLAKIPGQPANLSNGDGDASTVKQGQTTTLKPLDDKFFKTVEKIFGETANVFGTNKTILGENIKNWFSAAKEYVKALGIGWDLGTANAKKAFDAERDKFNELTTGLKKAKTQFKSSQATLATMKKQTKQTKKANFSSGLDSQF